MVCWERQTSACQTDGARGQDGLERKVEKGGGEWGGGEKAHWGRDLKEVGSQLRGSEVVVVTADCE